MLCTNLHGISVISRGWHQNEQHRVLIYLHCDCLYTCAPGTTLLIVIVPFIQRKRQVCDSSETAAATLLFCTIRRLHSMVQAICSRVQPPLVDFASNRKTCCQFAKNSCKTKNSHAWACCIKSWTMMASFQTQLLLPGCAPITAVCCISARSSRGWFICFIFK